MARAFCDTCNKLVQIKTETVPVEVVINGNVISVMGQEDVCCVCNESISNPMNSIYNLELAQEVMKKYKKQMDSGYI